MVGQALEKNPNWGGGRTQTPNGYWMVKVGKAHHLAHKQAAGALLDGVEHKNFPEKT